MRRMSTRLQAKKTELSLAERQAQLFMQAQKFSFLLLQDNHFDQAVACLNLYLEADPDNVVALTAKKELLIAIAKIHFENGDDDKCYQAYTHTLEVKISDASCHRDIAQGLLNLAQHYVACENYKQAIKCYVACRRAQPDDKQVNIDALLGWSRALIRTRTYEYCAQLLISAQALIGKDYHAPYQAALLEYRGLKYRRFNQYDEAIKAYKELLKIEPDNLVALKGLAILCRITEPELALSCIEKALVITPESADLWRIKAMCHKERDEFDAELVCYDKALEIEPNNVVIKQAKIGLFVRQQSSSLTATRAPAELQNTRPTKRHK